MVGMEAYTNAQHEMDILHLLARGEKEIAAGTGYELDDVLREADLYLKAAKPRDTIHPHKPPPVPANYRIQFTETNLLPLYLFDRKQRNLCAG